MSQEETQDEPQEQAMQQPVDQNRIQYLPQPELGVTNDAELAKELMRVSSRTTGKKEIQYITNKEGAVTGYRIVEIPNRFKEILTDSISKGNFNPIELKIARGHGTISNYAQATSRAIGVDLEAFQEFLGNQFALWLESGRAKEGFTAKLAKTGISISEQTLDRIEKQEEQRKKSAWSFLKGK